MNASLCRFLFLAYYSMRGTKMICAALDWHRCLYPILCDGSDAYPIFEGFRKKFFRCLILCVGLIPHARFWSRPIFPTKERSGDFFCGFGSLAQRPTASVPGFCPDDSKMPLLPRPKAPSQSSILLQARIPNQKDFFAVLFFVEKTPDHKMWCNADFGNAYNIDRGPQ